MNIRTLLLVAAIVIAQSAHAQLTRVQVINNSPDVSLSGIDVYIDGQLVADDVFFRTTTAFFDVQTGTNLRVNVTESTAFDTNSAFYSTNVTFNTNNRYVIIANGMKSTTGYSPQTPFGLNIFNQAQENAAQGSNTDVIFFNGGTDGPTFDARSGITTMAKQLSFGQFGTGYFPLSGSGNINIRFTNDRGNVTTHNFEGDFSNLGVTGNAVVLLTSGFVNTTANSNGSTFGLWVSSPNGGPLQELSATTTKEKLARIQFIHNSADTAVGKVDVFLNGIKKADTLNYHVASQYMDIFTGANIPLTVAHQGQSPFLNTTLNVDSGKTYVVMLHGIKSDTNYKPKPTFKATVFANAREEATNASNTDVVVMHGSTDAPIVTFNDFTTNFVTNLSYGSFSSGYTSFSPSSSVYRVDTGTNANPIASYSALYNTWNAAGLTATVVTSGFVEPDSNSKGPDFGLWAATANGGTMYKLPIASSVLDKALTTAPLKVWPNPASNILSFESKARIVEVTIVNVAGKVITHKSGVIDSQVNISALTAGNYYLIVSDGKQQSVAKFTKQ